MTGQEAVPALETRSLNRKFGALEVAGDINFILKAGARHALIGPNGAGKTTFVNLLTGILKPSSGSVLLENSEITSYPAHVRVRKGLARTFQLNTLLKPLTVLENVQLAVLEQMGVGSRLVGGAEFQRQAAEKAYGILERLRIQDQARHVVSEMPYGRQRIVEIALALALEPKVLLLDEPAAGVPPADTHIVFNTIASLPDSISILMIEHDMKLVFEFAEKISVLVQGRILCEGTPAEIAADPKVKDVYLGHRKNDP